MLTEHLKLPHTYVEYKLHVQVINSFAYVYLQNPGAPARCLGVVDHANGAAALEEMRTRITVARALEC
jgi:hypothetical protein